jgi:hypothetical protein
MKDILKNKFFLTAAGISLFILILVLLLSPKKNVNPAGPPGADDSRAPTALSAIVPINLSTEKRNAAIVYTDSIESKLPLVLDSFATSVGTQTYISVSRTDDDPAEIVHLDIVGLSYINKNELGESKNPNMTAFKESYLKAVEMLESQNIDPKRLLFVYSDVPYVHETATYWVDKLGLLR